MTTRRLPPLLPDAILLSLIMVILFKTGCSTYVEEGPGKPPLRYHNWWNYYERGRGLLKEGKIEDAKTDFEICLGLRRGAKFGLPEDMWRARTYGLHFLEGYFPHRELGICFYQLGQMDKAIDFLQKSMDQTPSGRAKFYVNQARRNALSGRKPPPPTIDLAIDSQVLFTRDRVHPISGTAAGKGFVEKIRINGRPQFIELAKEQMAFSEPISLSPGENIVAVEASDLLSQSVVKKVTWIADWSPPELVVRKMERQGKEWVIEGACHDDFGLATVSIGGQNRFQAAPGERQKLVPIQAHFDPDQKPIFEAVDLAGNRLQMVLLPDLFPQTSGLYRPDRCLAMADNEGTVADIPTPLLSAAPGAAGPVGDTLKPGLHIKGVRAVTEVFSREFFLDGNANDGGGLASVTINGEELLSKDKRGAISSYFARRLAVDLGTNRFEVVAQDLAGNKTTTPLIVVRRKPEYLDESYRLSVGVPPLLSDESAQIGQQVKRCIEEEILREPVRFYLLERDEGWNYILREQGLSLSDLSDPKAALRIHKMLPADMLLMTSIIRDGQGLTVYAKVVETTGGQVLLAEDVYSEAIEKNLAYQVAGLVMKIEQCFPLITGNVLEIAGTRVIINVGTKDGVRATTKFIVVGRPPPPEDPNLDAGKVQKIAGKPVELQTADVKKDKCVTQVLPTTGKDVIKEKDYVCAR